jgi:hypothetical protein
MKKLIPALFFCIAVVCLRAGEPTVTSTILTVGIIKEGDYAGYPGFRVETKIENQSADLVEVAYMLCSWDSSWKVAPDDEFLIPGWPCTRNFFTQTVLHPGDSMLFTFTVAAKRKDATIEGKKIKLGFIWQKGSSQGWNEVKPDSNSPVLWSKELVMPGLGDQLLDSEGQMKVISK